MLKSFWQLFKGKIGIFTFWGIILAVLLVNSQYVSYPDEFDNILGGKLILRGIFPYRGFFSHHGILGYLLSSGMVLIGGVSFIHFRFLSALFYLFLFALSSYLLIKRVSKFDKKYFLFFLVFLVVASTYFWGQIFLADVVSGYFLILPYALLFLKIYFQEKLERVDLWILSLFSAAAVLTSTTYLYAGVVLGTVALVYFAKDYLPAPKKALGPLIRFGVIFLLPYLFFIGYLLMSGSLPDFLFQAVDYNQKYYISNYPRPAGSTSFNPLRYAVVIFYDFFNRFNLAASGILSANFRFPLTHLFALANISLWAWLAIRKRWLLLFLGIVLMTYVNARGNPAEIKPADYQTGVYFVLSLLNLSLVFFFLKTELVEIKDQLWRAILVFLGMVLSIFAFFGGMFLFSEFLQNVYSRYMGFYPMIYDRPVVAPIFNAVIPANRYCWVGPFEFEEMFYSHCKLPSKYQWILPQFSGIEKIKQEIIADYFAKRPDVIVYRRDYSAFGTSAEFSNFFVDFLNDKYVRIKEIDPQMKYHFTSPKQKDFNFDSDFNLEKGQASALVQKLVEKGYVVSGK